MYQLSFSKSIPSALTRLFIGVHWVNIAPAQPVCQLKRRVPSHSLGLLTMTLITNITHDSTPFSRCHVHLEIIQNLSAEPYLEVKMSSCLSTFSMVDLGDSAGAFILSGAASLVAANSTPISSHSISEAKCCARKRNGRDSC